MNGFCPAPLRVLFDKEGALNKDYNAVFRRANHGLWPLINTFEPPIGIPLNSWVTLWKSYSPIWARSARKRTLTIAIP